MDHQDPEPQQNSLQNQLNQEPIQEQLQQADYTHKIDHIHQMISKLSEEEEILKETLKIKQRELLDTFMLLDQRKRKMRELVLGAVNQKELDLDIGLAQQFEHLKTLITTQRRQIDQLKDQLSKQGLSNRNNDQDFIRVYTKIPQLQKQIEIGKKFASTQFVRDYFDKPQVYKVAYEEVKYEFEIRSRIKQSLELEKQHYLAKKEQVVKAMNREKEIQQELLKEKDNLLRELKTLA